MPFNLGPLEITLIIVIVLLFFGPKRLPDMARSVGQAIQEFKKAGKSVQNEITSAIEDNDTPKTTASANKTETPPKAS
ncbi:twin-arginine translocase TatA/TatE family subunit [Candidatus Poribacteria bacterium]|nr:twin-arginine translocase TatA/TatE family subunit [Candidatus Poribacteria bacterium]